MTGRLEGKVAIVTGAGEGIGATIAYKIGVEGGKVVLAEIDAHKGRWRENWLRKRGIEALHVETDVASEEDVKNMVREAVNAYGRVDILVNNAGIGSSGKPIFEQELEEWKRVIDVNLTGAWLCSKYAAKEMVKVGGGAIINISSTRAFQFEPNTEPYSASKGGLYALTHALAVSLAPYRIRVNCIAPGWIDTSEWKIPPRKPELTPLDNLQHPARRVGKPEDIASLVAFPASDEASWITGSVFTVDGGMTRRMIYLDEDIIGWAVATLLGDEKLGEKLAAILSEPEKMRKFRQLLSNL